MRDVEKLKICRMCKGRNTLEIETNTVSTRREDSRMNVFSWCWDCDEEYGYQLIVENVHDKKERL